MNRNHARRLGLIALCLALALPPVACGGGKSGGSAPPVVPPATLRQAVVETRARHEMPALAAVAVNSANVTADVTGVRRFDAPAPAQVGDRFHLGSLAKAMTATLIAVYVEEGRLTWNTRVLDIFPEAAGATNPAYRDVTLEELLHHATGLPALGGLEDFAAIPTFPGTITEQRRAFTAWVLQQSPEAAPGSFHYSNAGYAVAAALLEKVTGESWESLLQRRVFQPLGMTTAGFGWPSRTDPNAPRGHYTGDGTTTLIDESDPALRVPPILAPAGDVHASATDYGRFLQAHLRGLRGVRGLLRPETVAKLHAPGVRFPAEIPGATDLFYAMGWIVGTQNGIRTSYHNGSADTFYAAALVQESRDRAVAAVTNIAREDTNADVDELLTTLADAPARSIGVFVIGETPRVRRSVVLPPPGRFHRPH